MTRRNKRWNRSGKGRVSRWRKRKEKKTAKDENEKTRK